MGAVGVSTSSNTITNSEENNKALSDFRALSMDNAGKIVDDAYQDTVDNALGYYSKGMNAFNYLQGLVEKFGLHGKPTVLSDADYDKQFAENALDGIEVYRGLGTEVNDDKYQQQFLYGDKAFIGDGIHGEGIYMTTNKQYAKDYATFGNFDGSTVTGYIDKSKARVITESALSEMLKQDKAQNTLNFFDGGNLSAYALYKGYNVIHVPGGNNGEKYSVANGGDNDFYIPLTRDVLVIREHTKIKKLNPPT